MIFASKPMRSRLACISPSFSINDDDERGRSERDFARDGRVEGGIQAQLATQENEPRRQQPNRRVPGASEFDIVVASFYFPVEVVRHLLFEVAR